MDGPAVQNAYSGKQTTITTSDGHCEYISEQEKNL